jgi:hypothetical protein
MILTLNDKLEETRYKPSTNEALIRKLNDIKEDWETKTVTQELFYVEDNLPGVYAHRNYLEYLLGAWDSHSGIVIYPDIIWYTLMCELTGIVAYNSDTYRNIFTTSDKKEDIIVISDSLTIMPMDTLIQALSEKVPSDVKQFIPEFSTSGTRSTLAKFAAFADMASPYYNYMVLLCGFPAIDVQGEKLDWERLSNSWKTLGKLFTKHSNYVAKVQDVLDNIVTSMTDADFWKKMFSLHQCGSGHQYLTKGWITSLFEYEPDMAYPENYASHISIVKYKQLNTQKEYDMKQGLFSSKKENGFLKPEFAHIIYERRKPEVRAYKSYGGNEPSITRKQS